jgi:hypothetical protein
MPPRLIKRRSLVWRWRKLLVRKSTFCGTGHEAANVATVDAHHHMEKVWPELELSLARRFACVSGFLCAAGLVAQWFFSCIAFYQFAAPVRRSLAGKPLFAVTAWTSLFYEHLPSSSFGALAFVSGVCLLIYVPLFVVIRRAGSIAWIALFFSAWFALLLCADLLFLAFVALGWASPVAYPIEPLRP